MATAKDALSQPLPEIPHKSGTGTRYTASSNNDRIHGKFIFFWKDFLTDVKRTLEKADLTGELDFVDPPEGELILVGNEIGLAGRFQANVGALLSRVFNISTDEKINGFRFGDPQVEFPDDDEAKALIMIYRICEDNLPAPRVVGKFKTFWNHQQTLNVRPSRIGEKNAPDLYCLEGSLGQLTRYMVQWHLKYGFLSTYKHTIFVRRTDRTNFEITDPIEFNSTNPTIRQCFFHMGMLGAGDDYLYYDNDPDTTLEILRSGKYDEEEENKKDDPSSSSETPRRKRRQAPEEDDDEYTQEDGSQGSTEARPTKKPRTRATTTGLSEVDTEPSKRENPTTTATPQETTVLHINDITTDSIFFGNNKISKHVFQIQTRLQQHPKKRKRIYTGLFNGVECIAKYFPIKDTESYTHERNNYRLLPLSRHFPKMLAFGKITVSAELERGHVIILSKEKGIPLDFDMIAEMPQEERVLIRQEVISAVKVLRSVGARHGDPAPWNILWDKESGKLIMLDFEMLVKEYKSCPADVAEVNSIVLAKWFKNSKD
ncbi:hypothetical protein TWF506_005803 [Arthrobotrys conoides]|uniref:Protein kinase domain-containing protein n=1 Tax=Arthrobotrys conoides TaxID=74498 RepID=A0AAN8S3V6_9PEZI